MNRLVFTFLRVCVIFITLFLGCDIHTPTGVKPEVRVLISAFEASLWQPHILRISKQFPEVNLVLEEAPNETNLVEDIYTSSFLLGSSPYDLVYMDIVWVPKFAAAGWLLPLEKALPDGFLADFHKGDIEGGSYNGHLYRIPFRSDVGMLYFRKDILKKLNVSPPETLTQLYEITQNALTLKLSPHGYLFQGKQYEGLSAMAIEVLKAFGGFWIDTKTLRVGLDHPESIRAIQWLRSMIKRGLSPAGVTTYAEEETRRIFQSGDALFLRNWPYVWAAAQAEHSPVRGNIGITAMPRTFSGSHGAAQGGWGFGVSAHSDVPEIAIRIARALTSPRIQKSFALKAGYLPTSRSARLSQEVLKRYPHFKKIDKVMNESVLRPPIPQYAQASDILQRYLSAALSSKTTVESAMTQAATETRALLGSSTTDRKGHR